MDWNAASSRLLKVELARKGVTYKQLVRMLEAIGVKETERSIANKMSRGTFSTAFCLQVLTAIGVKTMNISDQPSIPDGQES